MGFFKHLTNLIPRAKSMPTAAKYSRITCENIACYSSIVEQNTHLSRRGETCVTWNSAQLLDPVVPANSHLRLLSNVKKRACAKNSYANTNAIKTNVQMNNSVQPTVTDTCYGAQFDISIDGASGERHSDSDNDNKQKYIPPDFRIWEPVGKKSSRRGGFRFRVMSYNVLAQYLLECHPYLYTDCGLQNLKWKIRAAKIYDEILSVSPDILCLQEVQVSHLSTFYSRLEPLGYCGVFKQKTGARQDGCAIYYKRALFQLQDHASVEYYQPSMPILNRDNVALVVKLAPRCSPGAALLVATTHLLYNPKRADVRLAQLQVLLAELDRLAYVGGGGGGGGGGGAPGSDYLPIILAGDFNSTPDSAVIELLDRGHVSASALRDNSDWRQIAVTDNCQHLSVYLNRQRGVATDYSMIKLHSSERDAAVDAAAQHAAAQHAAAQHAALFNGEQLAHPLRLRSVYRTVKRDGRAEATTYQDCWLTVDYMYYSGRGALQLVERLRLPTAAECAALGRLPNARLGSDHLALAATFQLNTPDARL